MYRCITSNHITTNCYSYCCSYTMVVKTHTTVLGSEYLTDILYHNCSIWQQCLCDDAYLSEVQHSLGFVLLAGVLKSHLEHTLLSSIRGMGGDSGHTGVFLLVDQSQ